MKKYYLAIRGIIDTVMLLKHVTINARLYSMSVCEDILAVLISYVHE